MRFIDRAQAGQALAAELASHPAIEEAAADAADRIVVLGIPRGGVVVARAVADALGAQLGSVAVRKIPAPGNPEFGIGAIAEGVVVLDEVSIAMLRVSDAALEREVAEQAAELERRATLYGAMPDSLVGATAVIVDDGIATGGTAVAAVRWCRAAGAHQVVMATPVAAPNAVVHLRDEADAVVVLAAPERFRAVGGFYDDFTQVTDDEVRAILGSA